MHLIIALFSHTLSLQWSTRKNVFSSMLDMSAHSTASYGIRDLSFVVRMQFNHLTSFDKFGLCASRRTPESDYELMSTIAAYAYII